jgi:hypothetical protein
MIWPKRSCPQSLTWTEQAPRLAHWTRQRLINRDDVWQVYVPPRKRTNGEETRTLVGQLTDKQITAHYAANDPAQVIGLASSSDSRTSLWLAVEVERHGKDDPVTPGVNFQAALRWHEMLQTVGLDPILEEIDGVGGYRLLVLFGEPAPVDQVAAASRQLVGGYGNFGLHCAPRILPDPSASDDDLWLRLPGRHPSRDHFSRVWGGSQWLGPEATIEMMVERKPGSASLLRQPRPKVTRHLSAVEPRPSAPKRPAPTEKTTNNTPPRVNATRAPIPPPPPKPHPQGTSPLALTNEASQCVAEIAERTGLRDGEIVKRVFEWLTNQDEVVQAVVLGQIPQAIRPDAARLILDRLAEGEPAFFAAAENDGR